MIFVTRLDGHQMLVNPDLISMAEATPDTVLTFTTGSKLMVKERLNEIADRVVAHERRIHAALPPGLDAVELAARGTEPTSTRRSQAEVDHG